jgi:pimeloyl-ACP methyl ester carboxylesterase
MLHIGTRPHAGGPRLARVGDRITRLHLCSLGIIACMSMPSSAWTQGAATSQHARPTTTSNQDMTQPQIATASPAAPMRPETTGASAVRPFQFRASDEALADLRRRITTTRWPGRETVPDATQGVQLATMQKLARYWATDYDWRRFEARLNAVPQFVTNIDGLDIHFIHVRSKHANALPIILTHGWPGSIVEMMKVIDPLANPTAHGGGVSDAFDVVIPSLPGYGFSGQPTAGGWEPVRIARAWSTLMKRLGYTRYVAQGGDWGDPVTEQMAVLAPSEVIGIHLNMPSTVPPDIAKALQAGAPAPANLSAHEKQAYDQLDFFYKKGLAYALQMAGRPQTLYGLEDSPIGLAAWILDHDARSYALIARVFDGQTEGLTRDDVLDNVTLYWLTNTAISSARLYWENKLPFFAPMGVEVPVAVSAFPDELYQAPRSWAERAFPKLVYYNRLEKGGHFAAWEQPEAFVRELRAGFRPVRPSVALGTGR